MIYKMLSEFNDKILVIKKRYEQLCNVLAIPLLSIYFRDNENIWLQLYKKVQCSSVHNGQKLKNSWLIGKIYLLNGLLLGKKKE